MRDGLKLALSRRKENERLSELVSFRGKRRVALAQAMDEAVFDMTLCILIDLIYDCKMILVYHSYNER